MAIKGKSYTTIWIDEGTSSSSTASYSNNYGGYIDIGTTGSFGNSIYNKPTYSYTRTVSSTRYWIDDSGLYYGNVEQYIPPPTERFGKIANEYREDNNRRTEIPESLGAEASARFKGLSEM